MYDVMNTSSSNALKAFFKVSFALLEYVVSNKAEENVEK